MVTQMFPPHFTRRELECRCGCKLCNPKDELLSLIEKVRHALGDTPMIPTSCCRCHAHNAKVKGSPNSKHLTGRALDFIPKRMPIRDAYLKIVIAWMAELLPELGGIGIYNTFIHVDTAREADGHLRTWDERTALVTWRWLNSKVKVPYDVYADLVEGRGETLESLKKRALEEW